MPVPAPACGVRSLHLCPSVFIGGNILFALLLALGGCASPNERNVQPLRIADLSSRPTVGVLGKYLGQREVIEGTQANHVMMANGIAVTAVNGEPLAEPVKIDLVGGEQLEPGITYKLEGFEAGGFTGYPVWAGQSAQQSFGFVPFFVVTRTLQPATRP
jgi:hypothetical protein